MTNLIFIKNCNFKDKLKCDKVLVQKSGYFSRSAKPNKKDLEKSIYNKPIIYSKLHAVDIMNRSNEIIFTTSSNFYKFLVKVRKIKEKLFSSNQ